VGTMRSRSSGGVAMTLTLDVSAVPPKPAGAGRYIVELAKRLPSVMDDVQLMSRRGDDERWRAWSPASHVVPRVPSSRPGRLLYEAVAVAHTSLMRRSDVWHSPHYTMPHGATSPVVVTVHDMTFFTNPEWHERRKVDFFRHAIQYATREAAVILTVSEFTARQLRDLCPTERPVVVAPLGVDLERFSLESSDDSVSAYDLQRNFVLYVGTLEPRKGVDVLLRAFEEIAQDDPTVELWLAGQRGWGVDDVEEQIARHPFAERIRQLGFVDDAELPRLYRSARVVAYPSRGEGFGLPVLEALACGAPVVTTRDSVMAEVAGEAATLSTAGDAVDLAAGLQSLLQLDDAQRGAVRTVGHARAATFTWDRMLEQHLVAYEMAHQLR